MSAPYWGQLPSPNTARGNSVKRSDNSNRSNAPNDLTIDINPSSYTAQPQYPVQSQPTRQNRYSSQTTHTDAPTVSTQSPFVSPTASSFRGDGLAPRPPSFGYNKTEGGYNRDYLEKRRRRESRNKEYYDEINSAPPPAAPDAPKPPPPVSYKQPYDNGAQTSINRSSGPTGAQKGRAEEHYLPKGRHLADERQNVGRSNSKGKTVDRNSDTEWDLSKPERLDTLPPRKASLSEPNGNRRREWAPEKSPLQKLELTLDSITKEEKRARVEEAELLAREARAGRGGERASQNSVRFRNRPVVKATAESQAQPRSLPEAGLVRNLSNRQRDQLQRSAALETSRPTQPDLSQVNTLRGFEYDSAPEVLPDPQKPEDVVAQRKSSVRERPVVPVAAAVGAGATGLARSGSNKLKKEPPGDPWYSRRQAAEKTFQEITPRRASVDTRRQEISATIPSKGTAFGSHPQVNRDKDLPPTPRADGLGLKYAADPEFDESTDTAPVRRGSCRKIEQLTGEKAPEQVVRFNQASQQQKDARGSSQSKDVQKEPIAVNGAKFAIPITSSSIDPGPKPDKQHNSHLSNLLYRGEHGTDQDAGVYVPSMRLDEWKRGGVALLAGDSLDLEEPAQTEAEKDQAWWEAGNRGKRRRSSTKQRRAEAYDGEYDDTNTPTRFKPPLFLKSGPLLRYCGLRNETLQSRSRQVPRPRREIWRGSVMIVTEDSNSSYELAPTLRLFLQPLTLMPPPPAQVAGGADVLAPEYVDPIAGLAKVGRDGRTLYVRPVDQLDEKIDLSMEESDRGLFESTRSPLDGGSDAKRAHSQRNQYDGEKAGKYKEIRGFRLHAENGVTFWKFNLEIELRDKQQRLAYRINRGPATGFWVPAQGQAMNIMFHSCNGFSHGINPNDFNGPDPLWRDVLNTHQTQPFHVMLGGGDQVYMDRVMDETEIFKEWTEIKDIHHKENVPFTKELQHELEVFYLNRYCTWFSQGLFSVATSQIPMINIYDDHDIIDGFGSYPDSYMRSPVFSGLGAIAFKYYMLFQHQSSIDEGEETEPTWILGTEPGPFIPELSRSIFTFLGRSVAFLGLDCRTERMNDEIVSHETYEKVFKRLEKDIVKGQTKHLIVLLGTPVAYPRMVWLENILTSRVMEPVKALGRAGLLGKGLLNRFDGGVEILDDLDDHWTAKHHKDERNWFIQELQHIAAEKSVRITILGGDVHLGAVGQFYSSPKLKVPKDRDHRYMPNIISSAIVNAPPPDNLADILNRRNKVHHLDLETDEDMIPIFTHDVNGKPRNNKRLLNRRNWCSIRVYDPELTPPPTPEGSYDGSPSPPPTRLGILRRLSTSRGPSYRPDAPAPSAPPLSRAGGFFSRRASLDHRGSSDSEKPGMLTRTLSLTRKDFLPKTMFHRTSKRRKDSGGINGYGSDTETDEELSDQTQQQHAPSGLRGGGREEESYFPATGQAAGQKATRPIEHASAPTARAASPPKAPPRNPFHRTPTGLSEKQLRRGAPTINLEGGLDICLNVEVNHEDPTGITVPYRLLVPALWYEDVREGEAARQVVAGMKRWVSFTKKAKGDGQRLKDYANGGGYTN